ncbi:hypothetical protein GWK47_045360 [Chionoecetes opilio]|uniref:Uncharacterized protein n=1 Tax=Chionoecetes opilio TaxID=41210 RepID=A0A8J4YIF1_CHIOP|nr:hypothetical protein GWK47_045360 [Chionoecetes opilio]
MFFIIAVTHPDPVCVPQVIQVILKVVVKVPEAAQQHLQLQVALAKVTQVAADQVKVWGSLRLQEEEDIAEQQHQVTLQVEVIFKGPEIFQKVMLVWSGSGGNTSSSSGGGSSSRTPVAPSPSHTHTQTCSHMHQWQKVYQGSGHTRAHAPLGCSGPVSGGVRRCPGVPPRAARLSMANDENLAPIGALGPAPLPNGSTDPPGLPP